MSELAIYGGPKTITDGEVKPWPPIDKTDEKLVLDLLLQEKILLVQGSAFNIDDKQHLRVVFLPREDTLADAMGRLGNFLEHYRQ